MKKEYDIFISYRRLDEHDNISGRDQARLIAKQLELEGYHPFFDYSEIKDTEFDKVILPAIENCKVFILVLTKDSLNRCKNDDDWVRKEIETALSSGCKIISVTPDNTFNGWPSFLPNTLAVIKAIQISDIHMGSLFEVSVKELIKNRIIEGLEQQNKAHTNIGLYQDGFGRVGLSNKVTNSIITEAKYNFVSSFREGYAQIESNGKFGIINSNGIEVIPLKYEFVDIPTCELFSAHVGGRYGCLDKKNNIVIPFVFDELWVWSDIIVVRLGDKYGCLNRKNEVVIPVEYDEIEPTPINIVAKKHAKYGCFDLLGKETIPFIYDYIDVEMFHEGWAIARKEGKYGTIDKLGQVIIKFSYDQLNRGYNDEYDMLSAVIDDKEGRLNITGDVVIPIIYEEVGYKYDDYLWNEFGLAQVTKKGLVGAINKSGQEVIPTIYSFMSSISEDLWCVELNDKWGFIDEYNNVVIPFEYEELSSFKDGIARVKKEWEVWVY